MKFFTNKKIWEKIILALIFVLLFQFAVMKPVEADVVEFAGKLMSPIMSLLVTLGDGVMSIIHSSIMGVDETLIHVDTSASWWEVILVIVAVIITVACAIGAVIASGGLALFLGGIALISVGSTLLGSNVLVDLGKDTVNVVASSIGAEMLPDEMYLPVYSYSPEEIFKGNILLFNVNFFKKPIEIKEKTSIDSETGEERLEYYYYSDNEGDTDTDGDGVNDAFKTSKQDSAQILQSTISSWYKALRNICLVAMLSILVYIGIRMLLTSVASDKAKYITMLKDWFIGLCLLFLMHYIMAFSVTLVEKITSLINSATPTNLYMVSLEGTDKLKDEFEELGMTGDSSSNPMSVEYDSDGDGENEYVWSSNLMGYLRTKLQMSTPGAGYIGEGLCFLILVIFTVMFTFTYLRRVLYMAFLTLISPMVALTYCIDKLNDGQAQGFNKWFKEYIFNLLIQPMHLLLYYILVSSAFSTLGDNYIYSLVAIGFMIPAEKLLRSLFNFEKASTPGVLSGAASTALMMTGINKLTGLAGKGGKGSGSKNGGGSDSANDKKPPRTEDVDSTAEMLGNGENNDDDQQTPIQTQDGGDNGDFPTTEEEETNTAEQEAYRRYQSEGFGQNADGEYFNPWTDEYDPEYDPSKDPNYNPPQEEQPEEEQPEEEHEPEPEERPEPTRLTNRRGKIARKAKMIARASGAAIKTGAKRKLKSTPKLLKGIAVGTAIGGAAMLAGTSAFIASGEPGKIGTAVTAGIGGGYLAGKNAYNSKFSDAISSEVKKAYEREKSSPEYKEEQMDAYVKKLRKDEDIKARMKAEFGSKRSKEIMEKNGNFEEFTRRGVDDIEDIIAAEKLMEKNKEIDVDKATAIIQYDKRMGRKDPNKMKKKDRDEWETTFRNEYKNAGASEQKANDTVTKTMNLVHQLHKAKE